MTVTKDDIEQSEFIAIKELRNRVLDVKPCIHHEYILDELNLLRFIRARKSVDKAEVMFRKFIAWLEDVEFSKALSFQIREEVVDNFKWKISGIDNAGGPVVCVPVGKWDASQEVSCDELVRLALRSLAQIVGVAVKQFQDKDIAVQATGIADMKGLGMKHVTHIEGLKATLTMVRYFEANFPEYLRVVFVLNAPYVFSIAWKLVKPLITGTTHEKIKFVYSNYEKEIAKYVDPDQLPEAYGGTLPEDSEIIYDGEDFHRISNGNCEDIDLNSPVKI
ncbi:SEC14-like protein 2 [Orchesella cincta]|uniref:SEC14-like protein 2 n=1 Tax=Orchesella cincta TaxID=48709 RepID=A0A1D2NAK3_ORCCI|nr:SEC14-like protein 2 [Orchesella cincta]